MCHLLSSIFAVLRFLISYFLNLLINLGMESKTLNGLSEFSPQRLLKYKPI